MFNYDFLKTIRLGTGDIKKHLFNNFDWFIFQKDNGKFFVVPVWAISITNNIREFEIERIRKIKGSTPASVRIMYWSIPSYKDVELTETPDFPLSMCDMIQKTETNGYVHNFKLVQKFVKLGYKSCGLCRGTVMEQKHPILENIEKEQILNEEMSLENAAWICAEKYAEKVEEQYKDFVDKKHSQKEVFLDTFGLPY